MAGKEKHKQGAPAPAEEPETGRQEAGTEAGGEPGDDAWAALRAERDEMHERWLRAEADLANYRRRAARELEEAERRAKDRVLTGVLSLADDLERALDAAERAEVGGSIHQGVRLVHDRVRDILRSHGVEVVDPSGRLFDPHEAEAVFAVEAPDQVPGTVVGVIEKGYRVGDRLLRPAKVTVAKARVGDEDAPEPGASGPERL